MSSAGHMDERCSEFRVDWETLSVPHHSERRSSSLRSITVNDCLVDTYYTFEYVMRNNTRALFNAHALYIYYWKLKNLQILIINNLNYANINIRLTFMASTWLFCVINWKAEFLTALLVCNATVITSVIVTSPYDWSYCYSNRRNRPVKNTVDFFGGWKLLLGQY